MSRRHSNDVVQTLDTNLPLAFNSRQRNPTICSDAERTPWARAVTPETCQESNFFKRRGVSRFFSSKRTFLKI